MQFQYKYSGNSSVASSTSQTSMSFAPDTLRSPTFFRGTLGKKLSFREAISALHAVVVSDLRWRPKDREAYKAWAAEHEQEYLQNLLAENEGYSGLEIALESAYRVGAIVVDTLLADWPRYRECVPGDPCDE